DGVVALGASAPADRPLAGALEQHVGGAADAVLFFLAREIARDLMMVAVAGDFVAALDDRFHRLGISFRDAAAGKKGRLDADFVEHAQDAPDAGLGSVLAFRVILVVQFSVGSRPHRLAALKIERDGDRDAIFVGPRNRSLGMILADHTTSAVVTSEPKRLYMSSTGCAKRAEIETERAALRSSEPAISD